MTRKTLATFGPFGQRVRVFRQGDRVIAQWYVGGEKRRESWPATRENEKVAKAWAKGFAERRSGMLPTERVTLRELWDRYWAAESDHLRPRSQLRYRERWSWWERYVGRDQLAEDVTLETAARFRAEAEKAGKAVNQVRLIIGVARIVYNWGQRAKVIRENPLAAYRFKVGKDRVSKAEPAEYRREEFDRLVAQFRPQRGTEWRAAVILAVIGSQGVRENAALHLTWDAVDLVRGIVTWPGKYDKNGRTWAQPIRREAYAALLTARWWRDRMGFTGDWVVPGTRGGKKPYTAQALWAHLRRAEEAAGVPHLTLRALHGLRRMVVNDILQETGGDLEAAAQFIGDHDLAIVRGSYRRERPDQLAALAVKLDDRLQPPEVHRNAKRSIPRKASDTKSHRSELNRRPPEFKSSSGTQQPTKSGSSRSRNPAETGEPRPKAVPHTGRGPESEAR